MRGFRETDGAKMRPEILLAQKICPPTVAELEREYTVHQLWTAADPERWMAERGDGIRAVVTTRIAGSRAAGSMPCRGSS